MTKVLEFIVQCAPQVSPVLMHALVRRESAFNPLAIGPDSGQDPVAQPRSLPEAIQTARELKAAGKKFSVGLAQIHMSNVESRGLSWEQAFEPCSNLSLGQTILHDFYRLAVRDGYRGIDAVWAALRGYNSGSVHKVVSDRYARAIFAYMQQKQETSAPAAGARTTPASQQPEFASLVKTLQPRAFGIPAVPTQPERQETPDDEALDIFQKGSGQEGM